jgi:TrmH family RNA methyltransferase
MQANYLITELFICPDIYRPDAEYPIDNAGKGLMVFNVTKEVYEKMAYRGSVEGIIGVATVKYESIESLPFPINPLYLVLEKVEKPGNLGAIFRSADAAGVTAVFICDPACDPYNPNAIRSSLGCIFSVQWFIATDRETLEWFKKNSITIIATTPSANENYFKVDLKTPCAIVMGAEDVGLSNFWLKNSDHQVAIPMQGRIDSLNVSVSAAVMLFESQRQRYGSYN